jgi:hypothetical protein
MYAEVKRPLSSSAAGERNSSHALCKMPHTLRSTTPSQHGSETAHKQLHQKFREEPQA